MRFAAKLLFLTLFSVGTRAFAAACCGGGIAAPALIAGDERAQMTGSLLASEVRADVGTDGWWRQRPSRERVEDLRIEGAHLLSDRWQLGASVPFVRRVRNGRSSSGLGDTTINAGYEFLPDWDYNPWRPKGLGYLQLTIPSGESVFEAEDAFQLSARGRGFWALGLGTLLSKVIRRYDVFTSLDVHRSFARRFANSQTRGHLEPGWGGSLGVGGGYNLGAWRFGGGLTWTYEDPVDVRGDVRSDGSAQRYATAVLSAGRSFTGDWSASLNYTDQTWFGTPSNTSLSRGVMLVLQKRWLR